MNASVKRKLEEGEKGGDGDEGSSSKVRKTAMSKEERLARMSKWRNALEKMGGHKALGLLNGNVKVTHDGDHIEFYGVGTILDAPGFRWVAGEGFKPWAIIENGRWLICTPPLHSRVNKTEGSFNEALAKFKKKPMKMLYDALIAGGTPAEDILKIKTFYYKKNEKEDEDDLGGDKQPGASTSTS